MSLKRKEPAGVCGELTVETTVTTVRDGAAIAINDRVARETPVTLYVNGEELITLLCTPEKLDRLAAGFLRSEGLIGLREELASLRVRREEGIVEVELRGAAALAEKLYGKRAVASGCGKGTVFYSALDSLRSRPVRSDLTVTAEQVRKLMEEMQRRSTLFKATGGVHSAALAGAEGGILYFCEDIGRHNAVDKIVGECFLNELPLDDKILLSSGRLGSEILLKAAKLGLPVLVSRAAPTSLSVELAREMHITLIGFARGRRLNIYTHPRRLA